MTPTPTGESPGSGQLLERHDAARKREHELHRNLATFTSFSLTTGADSLTAMYSGSPVDAASTSSATTQNVSPPTVTTTF